MQLNNYLQQGSLMTVYAHLKMIYTIYKQHLTINTNITKMKYKTEQHNH